MFDMKQCKMGDKLVTREGDVGVFVVGIKKDSSYPYRVETDEGNTRYYGEYGEYFKSQEHDFDIIGFAHQFQAVPEAPSEDTEEVITKSPKITIVAKPSFVLSLAGQDVELTLDELKDLGATIINLIGEE
jgi:hypothetical protein